MSSLSRRRSTYACTTTNVRVDSRTVEAVESDHPDGSGRPESGRRGQEGEHGKAGQPPVGIPVVFVIAEDGQQTEAGDEGEEGRWERRSSA